MLTNKTKETIATVAGAYVGYRAANWLFPFVFILFLIGMLLGVGQCAHRWITGAPPVVEPQVDPEFQR